MFTFNNNQKKETELKGDEFKPPTNTYTEYNPFKGIPGFYPGQKLTYQIPTKLETLFEEDDANNPQRRGFSDYLTFYTGTSWVCGSFLGGAKGVVEGIKAAERGDSLKIRASRVLNSTGSVGRRVGNRGAVLGVFYSCIDGGINYLSDGLIHDDLRVVLAGVGTGALFRVVGGVRGAAVGAAVGGVLAGAYLGGRELINRFGPDLRAKFDKY
ncbi:mitochondrial import inner membrane translocase subunit TIM23-3-like [Silene latifolia]|uniref:mitochondrial import inner membrane translocase subunit TIM23-3-like n=1 Tax=Silene latifolia TaxID=37657 RepID=UPI003D76DFED